jgi:hypothetical protein
MENMDRLKETLCSELENYSHKENLSMADIDAVHKFSDTLKNLLKIEKLKGGERDSWGSYSREGDRHDGGYSNMHYVRGHYSRDEDEGGRRRDTRSKLIQLMNSADDDREREMLRRCVEMF